MEEKNINITNHFFDEIEKRIHNKRQYFKVLDNFILPISISLIILFFASCIILIFSGNQIFDYIKNKDYESLRVVTDNVTLINFLSLWSTNNYVALILGNIAASFGIFLSFIMIMEVIEYFNSKEIVEHYKKSMLIFSSIYLVFFSIFTFYSFDISKIPIGLKTEQMKFVYLSNIKSKEMFNFINFQNEENYNNLLEKNFSGNITKGNYLLFFIILLTVFGSLLLISILYFSLTFILNIRSKKYITLKTSDIDILNNSIQESIKNIGKYKEINSDKLGYYEKQNLFFIENKNKAKKIPYDLCFTQEIDMKEKWSKKLISIETDDKEGLYPIPTKKNIEKLKNKRKIDDLFLKDTN